MFLIESASLVPLINVFLVELLSETPLTRLPPARLPPARLPPDIFALDTFLRVIEPLPTLITRSEPLINVL